MKFPSHFLARATAAGALLASVALWLTGQASVQVGYTVLTVDAGNSIPMGSALFTYRNSSGVFVSEAGVGSADLMRSGRIFVDEAGTKTGVALVNPSPQSSTAITLILRDAAGTEIDRQPLTLGPRQQTARYISDWFSKQSPGFTGSLTFISTGPAVAAITLRESRNTQDEPLYTTLPVVDLGASATN